MKDSIGLQLGASIEVHRVFSVPLPNGEEVVAMVVREPAGWSGPGRYCWRDGAQLQLGLKVLGSCWGLQGVMTGFA